MTSQLLMISTVTVLIACINTTNGLSAEPVFQRQMQTAQEFYDLLERINSVPATVQLPQLEAFVDSHSWFARSAHWLFERYIIDQDLERAAHFFAQLPDSGLAGRNKNWVLAKIHARNRRNDEASKVFTAALATDSPTPELLLDYVVFDSRTLRKCADPDFLSELPIGNEALDVLMALWLYVNRRWQPAIASFNGLSPQFQNNPTVLYSWGNSLDQFGQGRSGRAKWERGLEVARALCDLEFECKFLIALGNTSASLEASLSRLDSSYTIARRIGDLRWLEYIAGNRGIRYSRQGHFSLADSLFREAIDVGRLMQSTWRMSLWYPRLGNLLVQQERFDEALKAYDEGASLARESGNTEILIRCLIREGEMYGLLGKDELARRVLIEARKKAHDRGEHRLEVEAHTELAHLDLAMGRYEDVRRIYYQYLEIPPTTRDDLEYHAWWRIQTGRAYLAEDRHSAARPEFQLAVSLADSAKAHYYTALSLLHLAEIDLAENDPAGAHQHLNQCQAVAEETELQSVLPAIFALRGDAYQKQGESEKALRQYRNAVNLVEQTRENLASEASKLGYFGDKSNIYDKLVECYRKIYVASDNAAYQDSLYLYMEMKRARTLRELRAGNGHDTGDSESDFRRDKLLQASKRLKSQQRYLRDYGELLTKQEMDSVLVQVQTARLSLIAQRLRLTQDASVGSDELRANLPSLKKLRSTLKANQSAAVFYHFSEHPFALAITGEATAVVSLPTTIAKLDSSIQALLNPFHGVTQDAAEAVFKADLAHELYQALLAPIEEAVALPENLLISPDAHLANLPFELLLTAKPERSDYTTTDPATYSDDFLIQRYAIGYVPNASFLVDTDLRTTAQNVLVFADPFDEAPMTDGRLVASLRTGWNFDPLVYSSKEASGIKDVHAQTTIFRRADATKQTLFQEAPRHDVVHFATHAFVDTTHDAFSGLVLSTSDDKEDDGILMGYEIADMELQADLVALSACETGRGKVVPGEGVLGLPRLFLGAGANTVLMTHWKVDDRFAADLMVDFYDHYLKQGLPKARALAAAKRRVLNTPLESGAANYRHPFYWASFAMYGEPGFRKQGQATEFVIAVATILLVLLLAGLRSRITRA